MTERRLRSKGELKKLHTNLDRKGITDGMSAINVDVLWRDKVVFRTAGFYFPGGNDSVIAFNNATHEFSITPFDPVVTSYDPRFIMYSFVNRPAIHRIYAAHTLVIPDEEGLYLFYFDTGTTTRLQELQYIKNPSKTQKQELYERKILVSDIYWDATNQEALCFGDSRHGSEVNPQQQWINRNTLHSLRNPGGLSVSGMQINADGSDNAHARFSVSAGSFWHDDFTIAVSAGGGTSAIPVMYFIDSKPRFVTTSGFQVYSSTGRLRYNNSGIVSEATELFHVAYHIFATNDKLSGQQLISVMGQAQYEKLAEAFAQVKNEVNAIYAAAPQQGLCYLGSAILQTSDTYTNSVKARIVGFNNDDEHPAVTIAPDSKAFLAINEEQELKIKLATLFVNETPTGTVDGVNKIFTIAETPIIGSEFLFMSGALRYPGLSYTINAETKTITFVKAPRQRTVLFIKYIKQNIVS